MKKKITDITFALISTFFYLQTNFHQFKLYWEIIERFFMIQSNNVYHVCEKNYVRIEIVDEVSNKID